MSTAGELARLGIKLALRKVLLPLGIIAGVLVLISVSIMVMAGGGQSRGSAMNDDCNAPGSNSQGTSGSSEVSYGGSSSDRAGQKKILEQIDQGVSELGFSGETTRIIAIAAFGESTLENVNYGDDIHGVTNPDGSATTSIGILQQQESWGSREERMNPKIAAELFILGPKRQGGGLADVSGWESLPETIAINRVQKNADPNHYAAQGRISYVDDLIGETDIDTGREGKTTGDGADAENVDAESQTQMDDGAECKGTPNSGTPGGTPGGDDSYPFDNIPGPTVFTEDGAGFFLGECTSYAMWKLAEHYGATGPDPQSWPVGNTKGGAGTQLGNGAEWKAAWEARGWEVTTTPTANAVAWWGANGASGIGEYGHVAWVDSVADDGKTFEISEYNNGGLAPPGHKYSHRPEVTMEDPQAPNAFLVPPAEDKL